jgi:hypothetical protein
MKPRWFIAYLLIALECWRSLFHEDSHWTKSTQKTLLIG